MQRIIRNLPIVLLIAFITLGIPRLSLGQTDGGYDALLSKGITALEQNDLEAALRDFKSALAGRPDGVQAHYYIAVTHARANRVMEAEASFKKSLEIERTFIPAHFDLGVLYYQTRKDKKALKSFGLVETIDPDRARVYFYQGVILKRNGKEKAGNRKLKKAVSLDAALAAEINFLSAASNFQAGNLDSAKKEFQGIVTLTPEGELADSARDFIAQIEKMPKQDKRRLSLSFSMGLQYDDNVILEPRQSSAAATGISSKSDFVGILYFRGLYQWLKGGDWSGDVSLSTFRNVHKDRKLGNFDIQDHHLSTSLGRKFGKNELKLEYEFQFASLAEESFLVSHKVGPRLIWLHSKKQITELSYFFGDKDFKDVPSLFPGNSERDVKTQMASVNHYLRIDDERSFYLGYSFNSDSAGDSVAEDDWSYNAHHIKAGIVVPFLWDISTNFEANLTQRQFLHDNQLALSTKRKDDDLLFILSFSKPFGKYIGMTAQYLYQDNNSNISAFTYRRRIIGLIATATY